MKKRIFYSIRTTVEFYLSNYFDAIKRMLDLKNNPDYEMIFSVVDVHATTTPFDKTTLARDTRDIIIDYLATGMDLKKSLLLVQ